MKTLRIALYRAFTWWLALTRPITVGVRLLLIRDGQVLLVRHTYQNGWYLTGGGVKRKETLEQAARREAREEAGAELKGLRLFGVYTNLAEGRSDHITVFVCEDFNLSGQHDLEIAALDFFALEALPEDLLPGHRRRVEEYLGTRPGQVHTGIW